MRNIEVVKKFAEHLQAKDLIELGGILADDFVGKGPSMELTKQQIIAYFQMLFTAFPDISFGLINFEQKGDLVFCSSHEQGTHRGILDLNPFGLPVSLPPTGKTFQLPKGIFTFRVVNDKVAFLGESAAEGGGLAGVLEQLGVKLS